MGLLDYQKQQQIKDGTDAVAVALRDQGDTLRRLLEEQKTTNKLLKQLLEKGS